MVRMMPQGEKAFSTLIPFQDRSTYPPPVFLRVLGQESRVPLVGHQQADPHDDVDGDEGVVGLGQGGPRDGHAAEEVHGVRPEEDAAHEEEDWALGAARLPEDERPDVEEDGQEGVAPPLLALQELDDVLVAVLGRQVQRRLAVAVARLQVHGALGAEQLDGHDVAGDAGQVER